MYNLCGDARFTPILVVTTGSCTFLWFCRVYVQTTPLLKFSFILILNSHRVTVRTLGTGRVIKQPLELLIQ